MSNLSPVTIVTQFLKENARKKSNLKANHNAWILVDKNGTTIEGSCDETINALLVDMLDFGQRFTTTNGDPAIAAHSMSGNIDQIDNSPFFTKLKKIFKKSASLEECIIAKPFDNNNILRAAEWVVDDEKGIGSITARLKSIWINPNDTKFHNFLNAWAKITPQEKDAALACWVTGKDAPEQAFTLLTKRPEGAPALPWESRTEELTLA